MLDLDWISIDWIIIAEIAAAVAVMVVVVAVIERARLNRYWKRACTGTEWQHRFPSVPKERIRNFLTLFVKSFGFSKKRQLKFSPNDKVMDIYRTLYPDGGADALELETFLKLIKKYYRIDLKSGWHENITLGEVFERIVHAHPMQIVLAHA